MGNFVKNNIEKTKNLYQKKYNTQYPCLFEIDNFEGNQAIIDFDYNKHIKDHVEKDISESRCQYCLIDTPK